MHVLKVHCTIFVKLRFERNTYEIVYIFDFLIRMNIFHSCYKINFLINNNNLQMSIFRNNDNCFISSMTTCELSINYDVIRFRVSLFNLIFYSQIGQKIFSYDSTYKSKMFQFRNDRLSTSVEQKHVIDLKLCLFLRKLSTLSIMVYKIQV